MHFINILSMVCGLLTQWVALPPCASGVYTVCVWETFPCSSWVLCLSAFAVWVCVCRNALFYWKWMDRLLMDKDWHSFLCTLAFAEFQCLKMSSLHINSEDQAGTHVCACTCVCTCVCMCVCALVRTRVCPFCLCCPFCLLCCFGLAFQWCVTDARRRFKAYSFLNSSVSSGTKTMSRLHFSLSISPEHLYFFLSLHLCLSNSGLLCRLESFWHMAFKFFIHCCFNFRRSSHLYLLLRGYCDFWTTTFPFETFEGGSFTIVTVKWGEEHAFSLNGIQCYIQSLCSSCSLLPTCLICRWWSGTFARPLYRSRQASVWTVGGTNNFFFHVVWRIWLSCVIWYPALWCCKSDPAGEIWSVLHGCEIFL